MNNVRRCLVTALIAVSAAGSLHAQAIVGRAGIRGTITSDGRPLVGARVVRVGSTDTVRADSLGRYALEHLGLGRHLFEVRQPGYQPIEMEVSFPSDTVITVDIPMESATAAASARLEQAGFFERRRQNAASSRPDATFLGPEDLAARPSGPVVQLLDGVRDVAVRVESGTSVVHGADGRCVMNVWLDGRQIDPFGTGISGSRRSRGSTPQSASGLDNAVRASEIAGIEIYPTPTRVPTQFKTSSDQLTQTRGQMTPPECGAIVIWKTAAP